jgi:hypothetical protein
MRMQWVVVGCAALAIACGGGTSTNVAPAIDANAATATPEPAVIQASSRAATTDVGVQECDAYLAKYTTCVSANVPSPVRAAMLAALDQSKNQWRAAASSPEGRAGLAEACTQARDAARASLRAYRCSW